MVNSTNTWPLDSKLFLLFTTKNHNSNYTSVYDLECNGSKHGIPSELDIVVHAAPGLRPLFHGAFYVECRIAFACQQKKSS